MKRELIQLLGVDLDRVQLLRLLTVLLVSFQAEAAFGQASGCAGLYDAIQSRGETARVQECTATVPDAIASMRESDERVIRLREYRRTCIHDLSPVYERAVYDLNCERDCASGDRDDLRSCTIINANAIKGQLLAMGVPLTELNEIKQETTGGLGTPENDDEWRAFYLGLGQRLALENSDPATRTLSRTAPPRAVARTPMPSPEVCRPLIQRFQRVNEGRSCRSPQRLSHLTFDDGPDTDTTGMALDTLREKGVSATFFVLGERLLPADPENPSATIQGRLRLIQRMTREGHVVGSHSLHHDQHVTLDESQLAEYARAARHAGVGVQVDGRPMPEFLSGVYRLPYGAGFSGGRVRSDIADAFRGQGFQRHLYWDIDTEDWKAANRANPDVTRDRLMRDLCAGGGGVILMHDIQPTTVANLGEWIDAARCNGYAFGDFESVVGPVPPLGGRTSVGAASSGSDRRSSDSDAPVSGREVLRREVPSDGAPSARGAQ